MEINPKVSTNKWMHTCYCDFKNCKVHFWLDALVTVKRVLHSRQSICYFLIISCFMDVLNTLYFTSSCQLTYCGQGVCLCLSLHLVSPPIWCVLSALYLLLGCARSEQTLHTKKTRIWSKAFMSFLSLSPIFPYTQRSLFKSKINFFHNSSLITSCVSTEGFFFFNNSKKYRADIKYRYLYVHMYHAHMITHTHRLTFSKFVCLCL